MITTALRSLAALAVVSCSAFTTQTPGLREVAGGPLGYGEAKWAQLAVRSARASYIVESLGGSVIALKRFDEPSLLRPPRNPRSYLEAHASVLLPQGIDGLIAQEADNTIYVVGESGAIERLSRIMRTMDVAPPQVAIAADVYCLYRPAKGGPQSYRLRLSGRTDAGRVLQLNSQTQRNTSSLRLSSESHQIEIIPRGLSNGSIEAEGVWIARLSILPAKEAQVRTIANRHSFSVVLPAGQSLESANFEVPVASGRLSLRLSLLAREAPPLKPLPPRGPAPGHIGMQNPS